MEQLFCMRDIFWFFLAQRTSLLLQQSCKGKKEKEKEKEKERSIVRAFKQKEKNFRDVFYS
jgi:hypothetical protein